MQHQLSNNYCSRSLFYYTSSFVYALLCILLLAGCGQAVAGAGNQNRTTATTTPRVTPSSTAQTNPALSFQDMRMFDANAGWSVSADGKRLLHTRRGMAHWQNVTPPRGSQASIDLSVSATDFLNGTDAWVSGADANTPTMIIYRTSDGGISWQKASVPEQGERPVQIFFLNPQDGWMLYLKGAATGNEAVDVLRTTDGGATWKIIAAASYAIPNPRGSLPFSGDKSGITFVNANTGWVTGFTNRDHFAPLYVTHDGGTTWQHQDIPLPTDAYQVSTFTPIFFNANDGVMPVDIPGLQGQKTVLYVTHNGGTSWSATAAMSTGVVDIVSADMAHSWAVKNNAAITGNTYINSTLYSTSDGGQHWTQHTVPFGGNITQLIFVSSTQGWALDEHNTLYATTDGGQTWMKVTPEMA